jgi:outer membrane protein TolC
MIRSGACICTLAIFSFSLFSAEPIPLSLEAALSGVARNNPGLKAAEARIEKARLQVEKAEDLGFLTRFDVNFVTGAIPGSDTISYFQNFGPFLKSEIGIIQPLFTFGKISGTEKLARHGLAHEREKFADTRDRATFEVIRLYRGLCTAMRAEYVARDMLRDFTKLTNQVEQELAKTNSTVDDLDKLDVTIKSWQVHQAYIGAMEDRTNLMRAMNIALGQTVSQALTVKDEPLPEITINVTNYEYLVRRASERHPSMRAMRMALAAADARIALEKANNYPDIFLGGGMRFNWAGNRPPDDDYNSKGVAAFVGIRWRLDLWRVTTEVDMAKSDRDAVANGLRFAEERLRHDIDKGVSGVRSSAQILQRVRDSLAAAKTYVRLASDNYDLGLGTSRTVANGYKSLYELQAVELKQELKTHIALAELALVLGDINKYMEWIKHEKVILE